MRDGLIIEASGSGEYPVLHASDIPWTMGGAADFQISNLPAAIAARRAYQVTSEQLRSSLLSFDNGYNSGRANLYRANNGYVMVDYRHNPDAFAAI